MPCLFSPLSALSRVCALLALLAVTTPVSSQEWRDFRSARQVGDVTSLEVELIYGAGNLSVDVATAPFLYDANLQYDTRRFEPLRGWSTEDGRGRLRLALTSAGDESASATIRLEDWDLDFDFGDLRHSGDQRGRFDFELSPDIPTDLRLRVGAAASRLRLGGLSLTSFELLTGASDTEVRFATPNRVRMSNMTLKAGAADFEASGLGNARFDRLDFSGAIGHAVLDFSGKWERGATATIQVGVGELTIRVPRDLGVRLERSSLLLSLDAGEFEKVDGVYFSPNWEEAAVRLEIDLEAALGSVKIERF